MVDSLSPHPENPDSAKQAVRQEMRRIVFSFSGCRRRADTGICRMFASVGMASYNSIIAIGEVEVKEEGQNVPFLSDKPAIIGKNVNVNPIAIV